MSTMLLVGTPNPNPSAHPDPRPNRLGRLGRRGARIDRTTTPAASAAAAAAPELAAADAGLAERVSGPVASRARGSR